MFARDLHAKIIFRNSKNNYGVFLSYVKQIRYLTFYRLSMIWRHNSCLEVVLVCYRFANRTAHAVLDCTTWLPCSNVDWIYITLNPHPPYNHFLAVVRLYLSQDRMNTFLLPSYPKHDTHRIFLYKYAGIEIHVHYMLYNIKY